ncbi:hypothetical protein MMC07_009517 [Pseudocyphellaria aurata]|nr:hypothetical protein [Pseudocyphellaria aurata]
MSPQRYERVSESDRDEPATPTRPEPTTPIYSSPPPSFRSRASSPTSRHHLFAEDPIASDADRTLADTFDDGEGSDVDENDGEDSRQRLMRGTPSSSDGAQSTAHDETRPAVLQRTLTEFPGADPPVVRSFNITPGTAIPNQFASANDGVFANLNAKPERGEKNEEQPPTYEQAAADATPPYWETTILTPGMASDEVYVDGLPVGSLFSFVWNGMISMSFQLVGFLLTYLLHTTHAAKNGSRAGLGITLVQYGFYMRGGSSSGSTDSGYVPPPSDPNSHDFDPSSVSDTTAAAATANASGDVSSIASSDWLAYVLMIVGWFILIRSVSDFFKARRHEQLVLQSPERAGGVPVMAPGESMETVV